MDIRFRDHASFHRAAAGMVGGGALLGFGFHAITPMAPFIGGLFGIAAGAALGYGRPVWRLGAATAASAALLLMPAGWPALAVAASLMALATAVGGLRGWRGLLAVALGAVTTLLAIWCAFRVGHAQRTITWPFWATSTASGAAMGMAAVLALIPRHLSLAIDPVSAAMRALPAGVTGEVRGLCERGSAIWRNAKDKLGADDPGLHLVRDGVLKALEVAGKSAGLEQDAGEDAVLARRITELEARIAASLDGEVRAQYQSAKAALEDQRRYRDHIKQNRERLIARMHNHVAALEKFQLAASGLVAVRAAAEGAPAVKQLEELSQTVAASGEALAELEIGVAPSGNTPAASSDATVAAMT
ncbi:MAG: hypothetical protein JO257_36930 [Deltaproteobacteria bacterium]|nr:hypothetical protein [Deltaproteobacteria bacterium]